MKNFVSKNFWIAAFTLLILDIITKAYFKDKEYLLNGFGIDYVANTGSAFGLFKDQFVFLIIVAVAVLGYIIYELNKFHLKEHIWLGLLFGGILGNLLNRSYLGYVIDFIAIGSFPRFNVADAAISISIVYLIFNTMKK